MSGRSHHCRCDADRGSGSSTCSGASSVGRVWQCAARRSGGKEMPNLINRCLLHFCHPLYGEIIMKTHHTRTADTYGHACIFCWGRKLEKEDELNIHEKNTYARKHTNKKRKQGGYRVSIGDISTFTRMGIIEREMGINPATRMQRTVNVQRKNSVNVTTRCTVGYVCRLNGFRYDTDIYTSSRNRHAM